jgi:DNA invertase Pin-like site-specific DNA recombinase
LREQIDTTTPSGKLVFHLFGALAEFEREVIRERTRAGLSSARARRGRTGGRPRSLDKKQAAMAAALLADRDGSVADICRTLGVSRSSCTD